MGWFLFCFHRPVLLRIDGFQLDFGLVIGEGVSLVLFHFVRLLEVVIHVFTWRLAYAAMPLLQSDSSRLYDR